jgi:hypothetical protein
LKDFLKANGLEVLLSLLKLENNPLANTSSIAAKNENVIGNGGGGGGGGGGNLKHSLEYETKQDIYIVLLQLLRLILFGSIYALDPMVVSAPSIVVCQAVPSSLTMTTSSEAANCKRPSTEPIITTCSKKTITSSMILSNQLNEQQETESSMTLSTLPMSSIGLTSSNAFNSQSNAFSSEVNNLNLIEKMTLSEVIDLVMQLLTIFWSASAGNIQLTYNCTMSTSSSLNSLSTNTINLCSSDNITCKS